MSKSPSIPWFAVGLFATGGGLVATHIINSSIISQEFSLLVIGLILMCLSPFAIYDYFYWKYFQIEFPFEDIYLTYGYWTNHKETFLYLQRKNNSDRHFWITEVGFFSGFFIKNKHKDKLGNKFDDGSWKENELSYVLFPNEEEYSKYYFSISPFDLSKKISGIYITVKIIKNSTQKSKQKTIYLRNKKYFQNFKRLVF